MTPDAPQREHNLREVFNAARRARPYWSPLRYLPCDFPRWEAVYQQTQRWLRAGSFEAIVHDLHDLLRLAQDRNAQPSAVIFDARTLQSTPESGSRAGYDGHKRKTGSKTHIAAGTPWVTLGHLSAMVVTPANEQERAQVAALAEAVQDVTGEEVERAYVDQGYTSDDTAGGGESAWHRARGRQAVRGQARLCAVASPLGGGALLCLGSPLPSFGQRLRAATGDAHRAALRRVRLPAAPEGRCSAPGS